MKVLVVKIVRKGKKTSRVLLSTGETVTMATETLPSEGSVYSTMTSEDVPTLRPLEPTDSFPSMLHL